MDRALHIAPVSARHHLERLGFAPDRFQTEAADAIDRGDTVVVTAPTGSGKTVVAEAAVHRALQRGLRAVYTTPIKALSNQKYGDFQHQYGAAGVGLLTGDNSINGDAPVVVMTTEVLRNMMYANSPDLADVGTVVLDEVHYLQDRARGAVWEEIIIHLDRSIPLVCLSATVANAEDFAGWIRERRGPTSLVVERERPVPLTATYLVRDRFSGHELRMLPIFSGDRPNERLGSMLRRDRGRRQRYAAPRRFETCAHLDARGLLPAIYFIFSRKGCEAAAGTVIERGLRLTTDEEADRIETIARESVRHLDPVDLEVLGFPRLLRLLRRGVGAHHAGMVPAMKELVERLFAAGLVRLVFATETLALGINMPARTAVLEQLSKFTGDGHETLQPGDFTQLTGRAGRRGIDTDGTAVVLHSRYLEFERVAGIAARESHPLRSSFRPTYNMAVNLIARYPRQEAERLLAASFAEFDRGRRRRQLEQEIAEERARLEDLRAEAEHPAVDIWRYLDDERESHAAVMARFAETTFPGAVLEWEERGRTRRLAVLAVGRGKRPRVLGVTDQGEDRRFASGKLPANLRKIGDVDLPHPIQPRNAGFRALVAQRLDDLDPTTPPQPAYESPEGVEDLTRHLGAARAARRLERRLESRQRQAAAAGPAVLQRFHAIERVLQRFGYTDDWRLTDKGQRLRTIYNELDLLLAEAVGRGLFEGLDAAATAGLASAFTFDPRHDEGPDNWPSDLEDRGLAVDGIWEQLGRLEESEGVEPTKRPDPGFAPTIMAWVRGASLDDLFPDEEAPVGDFVRNARQLLDLLRQIHDGGGVSDRPVKDAIAAIDRGVVAAAGTV